VFIIRIIFVLFLFISALSASITEDLLKLSDMYKQGLLSKEEFDKAKSILLEIEKIDADQVQDPQKKKKKATKKVKKKDKTVKNNIKIERIFTTEGSKFTNKNFEKMKLTVGDFLIYTHRPGAIKIKKISNNKQYAVIGDKLNVKYYNKGQDFLDIVVDKENKELNLKVNNSKILIWKGQYVKKAEATFYQILAMGRLPFHFYVMLDKANNALGLNMEKFNRRIELAVNEVKKDLADQYNISTNQIDQIIEQNDMMAVYGETIPLDVTLDTADQKKLVLYEDLKTSIGDKNFQNLSTKMNTALGNQLNKTVNTEIQVAIDESIRDAINSGIESAALEAGIAALIDALMAGASWADALKAGQSACASSGGC